jgi:hypothetical protein
MEPFKRFRAASAGLCLLAAGCATHTETGMAMGSGLGALTGAVIGHQSGHTAGGAVLGGIVGAAAGGLVGNAEDAREERDAAYARAAYVEAASDAMTNAEVIQLAQSGVSDAVILSSMRTRGGRFDLSPPGVIQLTSSGVSENVILAMQESQRVPRYVAPRETVYVPRSRVVVVEPAPPPPTMGFYFGTGPRCYGPPRHHHHHWHRHW